jgi:hypothetical protein
VVDEHPRFHLDALRWYAALTAVAGVAPDRLFVHVVGQESSDVLTFLRQSGVTVRRIERFDARSPHCNKISGALRMAEDGIEGASVLCDTDVAVLEDPRVIDLDPQSVVGKVVDAPVPPLSVMHDVFAAAGLSAPPPVRLPWGAAEWTVSGNFNGGLYLVPGPLLPTVARAWAAWARWLLERMALLKEWSVHVDQVSMALALRSEDLAARNLEVRWNTPVHDPSRIPPNPAVPAVIHYHQEVDQHGLVKHTGHAAIDSRIDALNAAVRDVWVLAAPHATQAAWASPAEPAPVADDDLQVILSTLDSGLHPASVLEVDGADEPGEQADLIVRASALPEGPASVGNLIGRLWPAARRALVVRACVGSQDPTQAKRLLSLLRQAAPDAEIYPLDWRRPCATFVLLKDSPDKHPRDLMPASLDPLVLRHPDPLGLLDLRLHALQSTGFYPDHAPRIWEYPVVARLIAEHLSPGSRVADVGAGVTPMAPFLAGHGYVLETVDPSEDHRVWPPTSDWNEWGFLDYAAQGLASRSWNCTLDQVPRRPPFDGIYSISVIEHVPATVRRALLSDVAVRTRPDGLVVLTIDLVRGSNDLWNLNLGVVVERRSEHGTILDVVQECAAVGLHCIRHDVVRDWGDSRVDVGLLVLRRSGNTGDRWRTMGRRVATMARRHKGNG